MKDTQFVPFDIAKLAYEHGYKEPSIAYYIIGSKKLFKTWNNQQYEYVSITNDGILYKAPTHWELIKWFAEKYDMWLGFSTLIDKGKVKYKAELRFQGPTTEYIPPYYGEKRMEEGLWYCHMHGKSDEKTNGWLFNCTYFNSITEAMTGGLEMAFNNIKLNKINNNDFKNL